LKQLFYYSISIALMVIPGGSSSDKSHVYLASPDNYKIEFGENYTRAEIAASSNIQAYEFIMEGINPDFAFSIVFPELIRFNSICNKFELASLFTLYSQFGEKYSDFSVGPFQMKPSFAFQIEKDYILYQKKLRLAEKFTFDTNSTSKARIERISRLNNSIWQAKYMVLFIKIMEVNYSDSDFNCLEDKLRFYAAAYNSGYNFSPECIRKSSCEKYFHLSMINSGSLKKYRYSDISADYFKSCKKKLTYSNSCQEKKRRMFFALN
jgi:hypothetical protein